MNQPKPVAQAPVREPCLSLEWLTEHCDGPLEEIAKHTQTTRAWFARIDRLDVFIKWYPSELQSSWARIESEISGSNLHPAIVPMRRAVKCSDGVLLIFDWVSGESLVHGEARNRFASLPVVERAQAVQRVSGALAAICDAGFMIVDWYDGNMIYDFQAHQIWLFDWELCRDGGSFVLEMDSNYGSSKLMAPEEFVRGSTLDQSTIVFNLGRYALLTLPELAIPLAPILAQATYPAPSGRYQAVRELAAALKDALTKGTVG
jgi:serine/threonine-protein kinase